MSILPQTAADSKTTYPPAEAEDPGYWDRVEQQAAAQAGVGPPPQLITAAQLVATDLPEPECVVKDVIVEGLNLLAGKPKLGKSWLALDLAIAVAAGGVAIGKIGVQAGDVLYLALEDNRRRLKKRLQRVLPDQVAPDRLHFATEWPRADRGGITHLDDWLTKHPAALLVIIDTLARFRPPRSHGGSSYDEDYQALVAVKELADKHGVAIIVVHHVRKLAAEDPFDTVSGTTGLTGAADTVLLLSRQRGQCDAVLHVTGRDLDEQELALKWHRESCTWSIMGEAEEYRRTTEQARVIEVLAAAGKPLTPRQASLHLGKPEGTVKVMLWRMAQEQVIANVGGAYTTLDLAEQFTTEAKGKARGRAKGDKTSRKKQVTCNPCNPVTRNGQHDVTAEFLEGSESTSEPGYTVTPVTSAQNEAEDEERASIMGINGGLARAEAERQARVHRKAG